MGPWLERSALDVLPGCGDITVRADDDRLGDRAVILGHPVLISSGWGPRIWFQVVSDTKTVKNRLDVHVHVHVSAGRAVPIETRRQRVDAEARRLSDLGATMVGILAEEGLDHYAVAMKDPGGNEFDIN